MDEPENKPSELALSELAEAARRAGSIVNERIDSIVQTAERQAEEIRREAERDAEETRRDAVSSASRVFEQIAALEGPLAELVGTLRMEAGAVQREIEGGVDAEAVPIAAKAESLPGDGESFAMKPEPEQATEAQASVAEVAEPIEEPSAADVAEPTPEPVEEPQPAVEKWSERPMPAPWRREEDPGDEGYASRVEPDDQPASPVTEVPAPEPSEPVPAAAVPEAPEARKEPRMHAPPPFTMSEPEPEKGRGFFSRLRPGGSKRPFISTPGHCAVCQKTFEAGDEATLRQSGWKVNDDVGLCPEDQADGWQLPEGARLPFRRGGS